MKLKYAIEQRLRFIDFLVSQYGFINRDALMDYYGISTQQASNDLGDYIKLAPGNLEYSLSLKRYTKTAQFVRVWE